MKCPRCESTWTSHNGLGSWNCRDCGTVFGSMAESQEIKIGFPCSAWVILVEIQGKIIPILSENEHSVMVFDTELDAKWFFSEHILSQQNHWIVGLDRQSPE